MTTNDVQKLSIWTHKISIYIDYVTFTAAQAAICFIVTAFSDPRFSVFVCVFIVSSPGDFILLVDGAAYSSANCARRRFLSLVGDGSVILMSIACQTSSSSRGLLCRHGFSDN